MSADRPVPEQQVEDIAFRRHADGTVEVLTTPDLSAVTVELLVAPEFQQYRDPDDHAVFEFAPGVRYRLGALSRDGRTHLLHRVPPEQEIRA